MTKKTKKVIIKIAQKQKTSIGFERRIEDNKYTLNDMIEAIKIIEKELDLSKHYDTEVSAREILKMTDALSALCEEYCAKRL